MIVAIKSMNDKFNIEIVKSVKKLKSEKYNYIFGLKSGGMMEWGKTLDDTPDYSPFGPIILDVEVTSICEGPYSGPNGKTPCSFCYKSNGKMGHNMSLETFKSILGSFPKDLGGNYALTQIAFGVDAQAKSNPDLFMMMKYARDNYIIPNITVADVDFDTSKKIVEVCGACAVSAYKHADNFETCLKSIDNITNAYFEAKNIDRKEFERKHGEKSVEMWRNMTGMQINIHYMLSNETFSGAHEIIDLIKKDKRLSYVNALVFLGLKQKGRGCNFNIISKKTFDTILHHAYYEKIRLGFDTCLACRFNKYLEEYRLKDFLLNKNSIETCCAGRISAYINEHGEYYPCSFMEGVGSWKKGIKINNNVDFLNDVWYSPSVIKFGVNALDSAKNNKGCQYWDV